LAAYDGIDSNKLKRAFISFFLKEIIPVAEKQSCIDGHFIPTIRLILF